jgi:hypothetical protein
MESMLARLSRTEEWHLQSNAEAFHPAGLVPFQMTILNVLVGALHDYFVRQIQPRGSKICTNNLSHV